MFKKIIIFMTSLLLIINSTLTSAATIGAWTVSNPMAVGASILYDGSKGAVTSSVLITPNASQVAKVLRGGLAGYALTLAVEQLLGAVDWVLDPANNQIKYKPISIDSIDENYSYQCLGSSDNSVSKSLTYCGQAFATSNDLILKYCDIFKPTSSYQYPVCRFQRLDGRPESFVAATTVYDPKIIEQKTLPLETVAQQVIENAESDNLDAQFAVLAAANNILSEAENDDAKAKPIEDELENNAKDDTCVELWEDEIERCEAWKGQGSSDDPNRWFRACKERATNRLRICQRTGVPTSNPPEWNWSDIK